MLGEAGLDRGQSRQAAGNHPRYRIRHYYPDTTVARDLFPGQSPLIDQSWSAGATSTRALHSLGMLQGSSLGITADRTDATYDSLVNAVQEAPG